MTQGLYAWVPGQGLYASVNAGASWSLVTASGAPSPTISSAFYPIKIDKFGQVWVQIVNGAAQPMYKYSGGGASGTWSHSTICTGSFVYVTFDSSSASAGAEKVYAWCANGGGSSGAYHSTNGGTTWASLTTQSGIAGGDVPWLVNGPSATVSTSLDVHDATLDLAGNLYLAAGYGVYYGPTGTSPFALSVQSAGYESSTNNGAIQAASGLGFTQGSWDTGLFANFGPTLYAYNNFANSSPTFFTKVPAVAGTKPWISCSANGAPWDGCSNDGGKTFTQWTTAPPGEGSMATIDGTDILLLTGGVLYCNTTAGVGSWATVSGPPAYQPGIFEVSAGHYEYVLSSQNVVGTWTSSGGCGGTFTEVNSSFKAPGASHGVAGQAGLILQDSSQTSPAVSTNAGITLSSISAIETLGGFTGGAGKPGASTSYTLYANGLKGGTYATWDTIDGVTTWNALSTLGLNGYFGYSFVAPGLAADLDIYGVLESATNAMGSSVIALSDSCPAVYWNPKIVWPTETVSGTQMLTAQDSGLAVPTAISFVLDIAGADTTLASFVPSQTAASYSFPWNTSGLSSGAHTLSVVSSGNGCTGVAKTIPITK